MSLLNEDNKWVKETHESHHEMELLQAKCCLPSKDPTDLSAKLFAHFESEEGKISTHPINAQVSAVTITDKEPVDDTLVRSKRKRVEPIRLGDEMIQTEKYQQYGRAKRAKTIIDKTSNRCKAKPR